jgi:phosphatidylinositol glycan class B
MAGMLAMWLRNPRHLVTWVSLPFVLGHMAIAHKEARFLFPLAILATAFPVLGFSPQLPRWRGLFARVWSWRARWQAKVVTALSLLGMTYFAFYPFGVRPHMPMARYLYHHNPGTVYSFAPPFLSYPMFRPAGFAAERLHDAARLNGLVDKGPVFVMSQTPTPPPLPAGVHASLVYSEFPLAQVGYGEAGADFMHGYTEFSARYGFLKLLPLYWYSLYRVERSATIRS